MQAATAPEIAVDRSPRRLVIGGRSVDAASHEHFDTINPATGESLCSVARGTQVDVDRAVAAARRAFEGPWRRTGPGQRQRILERLAELVLEHRDELAVLDTVDMGAPLKGLKSRGESLAERLRWCAAAARGVRGDTIENARPWDFVTYTVKEPVGVVGAITPWNSPLLAAVVKVGPVLATGCTVVVKPAEESPLSALRFAELCRDAGVPDGVVNVVTGDDVAGAALAAHPGVDKVSFTGSVETGEKIVHASAGNLKRLTLELGGKSASVVFADADLDAAANGVAMSIFRNSGQVCFAGSRLFVQSAIYDEFIDRVADVAHGLVVGDPLREETNLGPLVSQTQLDRVLRYIKSGVEDGARLVCGGTRPSDPDRARGYFMSPTIFANVDDQMSVYREEIFGPVLVAAPFDDEDDVIRRANDTIYGLGAYLWTRDVTRVHRFVRRLETGTLWVNTQFMTDDAVAFGGWKQSGYGHDAGPEQIANHQRIKAVWIGASS